MRISHRDILVGMRFSVSRTHYSVNSLERSGRSPIDCKQFFIDQWGPGSRAIGSSVVTHNGKLIGVLRYKLRGRKTLRSLGIWVDPEFRGQNIAHRLFCEAMRAESRTIIKGYSVSTGGARLLLKLSKSFKVFDSNKSKPL